jgi:hypothetical protein
MGSGRSDLADWRSSGSGDDCPGEMFLDFERTANHTLLSTKDMHKTTTSPWMTNWRSCVCVRARRPGRVDGSRRADAVSVCSCADRCVRETSRSMEPSALDRNVLCANKQQGAVGSDARTRAAHLGRRGTSSVPRHCFACTKAQ